MNKDEFPLKRHYCLNEEMVVQVRKTRGEEIYTCLSCGGRNVVYVEIKIIEPLENRLGF